MAEQADERQKRANIYNKNIIHRSMQMPFAEVGKNIKDILLKRVKETIENKCIDEGFVKKDSSRILTYSSGMLEDDRVLYNVAIECGICRPMEDMVISNCRVVNVTKAGIRAELNHKTNKPFVIFVTRDHMYENAYFSSVKEEDIISIKVIGTRFELNDPYISIIADLVNP